MVRLLMVCILAWAVCTTGALAQSGIDATLNWVLPTTYENGEPLDADTDLAEIRIYQNGALVQTAGGAATTATVFDLPFGDSTFFVTAVATNGAESLMSNEATRTVIDNRAPSPPTLLDVILAWLRSFFSRFA